MTNEELVYIMAKLLIGFWIFNYVFLTYLLPMFINNVNFIVIGGYFLICVSIMAGLEWVAERFDLD